MTRLVQCLVLLIACAVFVTPAFGTVVCSVSSTGTAFGGYDTVGANAKDVVGTISVTCTGSIGDAVNYAIALSPGAGSFA
jgi:spore coat protein U-like protein